MVFKNLKLALAVSFSMAFSVISPVAAEPIKAFTAVLPPFTIGTDADMPGISHELLTEMAARANVDIEIIYLPWKRAQSEAQKTPNTLIFTLGRSSSREDKYSWVSELLVNNEVFVTTSKAVNSLADAKNLERVSILGGSRRERRLTDEGFTNLQVAKDATTAARLLTMGRVEAWYTFDNRALFALKSSGADASSIAIGEPIKTSSSWLAANKVFDPATAAVLQKALEDMRSDGTYNAILNKYRL